MSAAVDAARAALAGTPAWVVGGAVRDELLGRQSEDVDVAVEGAARPAARALARAVGGMAFELSGQFGAWRVLAPDRSWHVDVSTLQGETIEDDLAQRDFTVNAMARPLAGPELLDPHGGREDLAARRLRMVAPTAFEADPLRTLRLARFACELDLAPEPATEAAAQALAPRIADVAAERVFGELKRVVVADRVLDGLALMDRLGVTAHVLPELERLRGVEQNRYHHLDVREHTLAVLASAAELERDPAAAFGDELAEQIRAYLAEPLADELTRAGALRLGALLHDVAKPETQARGDDGEVLGFPGHAELGAERAREALTRLRASERLRAHVAGLTRHHLALGFLVHEAPLDRRAIHRYLVRTAPVEVDVTLLSVADRLATRGHKGDVSIARHLDVAHEVLPHALAFREESRRAPLVRGDVLAGALGIRPGPELGRLLEQIAEARFAGEVETAEDAIALARRLRAG